MFNEWGDELKANKNKDVLDRNVMKSERPELKKILDVELENAKRDLMSFENDLGAERRTAVEDYGAKELKEFNESSK